MAFEITTLKASPTGKRFDGRVKVVPLWADDWEFRFRIMAYEEIPVKDINRIIDQVIDRRREWKSCKKSCSLNLNGWKANAFIWEVKAEEKPTNTTTDESN